jgi:hypothetical protein
MSRLTVILIVLVVVAAAVISVLLIRPGVPICAACP